jgi:prepilin-type N-terminal cleavage/methylation domain-containing protein/prepilin-type processing-associated H-X9-DG protein
MRPKKRQNRITAREIRATSQNFHAAFTLTELLAVVALVGILFVMMLPGPHHKANPTRIRCVNNLKNVGLAYRIYASDHDEHFPWEFFENKYSSDPTIYIYAVTNELYTPQLNCPADTRPALTNWTGFSRTNVSYFISPDASTTFPQSFLAGDRNITNEHGTLRPGLHAPRPINTLGWDQTIHKNQGNAAMADGSVQQLSAARLREQLRNTGQSNQNIKFSIP